MNVDQKNSNIALELKNLEFIFEDNGFEMGLNWDATVGFSLAFVKETDNQWEMNNSTIK